MIKMKNVKKNIKGKERRESNFVKQNFYRKLNRLRGRIEGREFNLIKQTPV